MVDYSQPGYPMFGAPPPADDPTRKRMLTIIAVGGLIISFCCCSWGGLIGFTFYQELSPKTYVHNTDCRLLHERMVLTGFRMQYPGPYHVLPCGQGQNSFYVMFLELSPEGDEIGKVAVGWFYGPRDGHDRLVDQIAESINVDIPGSSYQVLNAAPLPVNGVLAARKDFLFVLPARNNDMAPGQYIFRIVMLPGPPTAQDGFALIMSRYVSSDTVSTTAEMDEVYGAMVNSITF